MIHFQAKLNSEQEIVYFLSKGHASTYHRWADQQIERKWLCVCAAVSALEHTFYFSAKNFLDEVKRKVSAEIRKGFFELKIHSPPSSIPKSKRFSAVRFSGIGAGPAVGSPLVVLSRALLLGLTLIEENEPGLIKVDWKQE